MPDVETPAAPLIVTLRLGAEAAGRFSALRRAHFPPHRNWLDAHVTLFHALPGAAVETVLADAADVAARQPAFTLRVERLLFLGAGVAYALAAPEADRLRRTLAERWAALLGAQDRSWRGPLHVTIQNKVAPAAARALHRQLAMTFEPEDVPAVGIDIWYYQGGPWRHAATYAFVASSH